MEKIHQSPTPGETSKDERVISTIESLMDGKNNQAILENLKMYHDANRGSRISIFHENIENSEKIMAMTEAVYSKMEALKKQQRRQRKNMLFWF